MTNIELIQIVKRSFELEQQSKAEEAMQLLHADFSVTEMNLDSEGKQLFRRLSGQAARDLMQQAFQIKTREYEFKTIIADEATQTVVVEFVESYDEPDTGKRYRTPIVAIIKIKDGLIWRTRHYCDTRLSYLFLERDQITSAFDEGAK